MPGVVMVHDLDLHLGHVHAGRAFPAAALAAYAEVQRLTHFLAADRIRPQLPAQRQP